MNKLNRPIDKTRISISKENTINNVMNSINSQNNKNSFRLPAFRLPVYKIGLVLSSMIIVLLSVTFILSNYNSSSTNTDFLLKKENTDTLVELSYITGSITISQNVDLLLTSTNYIAAEDETLFETDIIEFNSYFEAFKNYTDEDEFDSIIAKKIEDSIYMYQLSYSSGEDEFILSVNFEDSVIDGILQINDDIFEVEGLVTTNNNINIFEFIVKDNQNQIKVTNQNNTDNENAFTIESLINGNSNTKNVNVLKNSTGFSINIVEDGKEYTFSKNNSINNYRINYNYDDIFGEVDIKESKDKFGNTTYQYQINEHGKYKSILITRNRNRQHTT